MAFEDYIGVSFVTSIITSGTAYFIQRKHKIKDAFKAEKDKKIVEKTFDVEVKLFEIVNNACNQFTADSQQYKEKAIQINTIRSENIIFISNGINKLCSSIADYLLLVAVDPTKADKEKEQWFIKKFKKKFRK